MDEIEGIIARTEAIREKWNGNPGYARQLDIELLALRRLRDHRLTPAGGGWTSADEMRAGGYQPDDGPRPELPTTGSGVKR
jgi:hypothetical protein